LDVGPVTPEVRELTAQTISRVRGTDEAREGFAAFLAKRPPPPGSPPHDPHHTCHGTLPRAGGRRRHHGCRHRPGGGPGRPHRAAARLRAGAAAEAKAKLATTLDGLVAKGKPTAEAAPSRAGAHHSLSAHWSQAAAAGLVVEAIVEDLDAKRACSAARSRWSPQCVLATNTSSISVTAIANGLQHPGRLVGMHFFNPVPLMKLVEVVSGLHTACEVAEAIFELSLAWGKVPVHARSTPGFIVNRIARPYYAETLALLLEQRRHAAGAGRLPARRRASAWGRAS
jgi:hypothetical protein